MADNTSETAIKESLLKWMMSVINRDYALRMRFNEEIQKQRPQFAFPREDGKFCSFEKGVSSFKDYAACYGLDMTLAEFLANPDDEMLAIAREEYSTIGKNSAQTDFFRALVEAETGFCNLTEKEFKALQQYPELPLNAPEYYEEIRQMIPPKIKNVNYKKFMGYVGDALTFLGVVNKQQAEVDASLSNLLAIGKNIASAGDSDMPEFENAALYDVVETLHALFTENRQRSAMVLYGSIVKDSSVSENDKRLLNMLFGDHGVLRDVNRGIGMTGR